MESLYLRAGIHNALDFKELAEGQEGNDIPYKLAREGYKFLVTEPSNQMEAQTYWVQFESELNQEIVVDILDWNPDTKQENLTLYARKKGDINENTHRSALLLRA